VSGDVLTEPATRSIKGDVTCVDDALTERCLVVDDVGSRTASCILCMESIIGGVELLQQHLLMVC